MKLVEEQVAKDADVMGAVERALDETLEEFDADISESERDLAEADELYEEAEGRAPGAEHSDDEEDPDSR